MLATAKLTCWRRCLANWQPIRYLSQSKLEFEAKTWRDVGRAALVSLIFASVSVHAQSSLEVNANSTQEVIEEHRGQASLSAGGSSASSASAARSVTLNQNLPTVTIADASADEGKDLSFTVTLSAAVAGDVSFKYATSIGSSDSAEAGDFTAVTDGSGTIAEGDTEFQIKIRANADTVDEPDDTFSVTLSSVLPATLAVLGTASSAQGTIKDTTDAPTVSIASPSDIREPAADKKTKVVFPVTISPTSERTITYKVGLGGTAEALLDYNPPGQPPYNVSIAPFSDKHDYEIEIMGDRYYEAKSPETVTVRFFDGKNVKNLSTRTATAKILDLQNPPLVTIDASSVSYTEGTTFPVTLVPSTGTQEEYTVKLNASPGSATGADFDLKKNLFTFAEFTYARKNKLDDVVELLDDDVYEGRKTLELYLSDVTPSGYASVNSTQTTEFTIVDSTPAPKISITADASATEGDKITFRIASSEQASKITRVYYYTTTTTASVTDFGYVSKERPKSIEIPASSSGVDVEVQTTQDTLYENNETFKLVLSTIDSRLEGITIDSAKKTATGTILADTDVKPKVSIAGPSGNTDEGGSMTFGVSLSTANGVITSVPYSITGTSNSSDYKVTPASPMAIATGATSANLVFATVDDRSSEGDETVIVTLGTPTGADLATSGTTATGNIIDNDSNPQLSIADATIEEGDAGNVKITTSPVSKTAIKGTWKTADGTGEAGKDYTSVASGSFTIDSNKDSTTIQVSTTEDAIYEGDETLTITIASSDESVAGVDDGTATITIEDDEDEPTISLSADSSATEGSEIDFTVTVDPVSADPVSFKYLTTLVTGSASTSDFSHQLTANTVNLAAGVASTTISIATTDDDLYELNETFSLTISAPTGGVLGTKTTATGTINNDDSRPKATLTTPTTTKYTEGNAATDTSAVTFTVELDEASGVDAKVVVSADASSEATAGEDFTLPTNTTITISAGSTSTTFDIKVIGDDFYEDDETITLKISAATGGHVAIGTTATASVDIVENETVPVLSVNAVTVDEDDGNATITVTSDTKSAVVLNFKYVTTAGTASAADYTHSGSKTSASLSAKSLTTSISIPIVDDTTHEATPESFTVTFSDLTPSGSGTWSSEKASVATTVTITDDDTIPKLSIADGKNTEGDPISLAVTLTNPSAQDITFNWKTTDGTAIAADGHYTAQTTAQSVDIEAGDTSHTISVATADNAYDAPDRTFTVTVTTSDADVSLNDGTATGTIEDDETAPIVSFSSATVTITEPAADATSILSVPVAITPPSYKSVTVPFTVSSSKTTAVKNTDYTLKSASPLTIPAESTGVNVEFNLAGDGRYDGEKRIFITLGTPTGASLDSTRSTAEGVITDKQVVPNVSFKDTSVTIDEGNKKTLTLELEPPASKLVLVTVKTVLESSSTASANDFTAIKQKILRFEAGDTEKSVEITTTQDRVHEPDETFVVAAKHESGPLTPNGTGRKATITIKNDEPIPTANLNYLARPFVIEGQAISFTTVLTGASYADITVTFQTLDKSDRPNLLQAVAGQDFVEPAANTTVTFKAGTTKSDNLSIQTIDDAFKESSELFLVRLHNPPSHAKVLPNGLTVIINDNDEGDLRVSLSSSISSVDEDRASTSPVTLSISLSRTAPSTITVPFKLEGTATVDDDYSVVTPSGGSRSIVFSAGDSEAKSISLQIEEDAIYEGDETITVKLGAIEGASGSGSHTITIKDNESVPTVGVTAPSAVTEGNDPTKTVDMSFSLTLSHATAKTVSVPYTLGGTAKHTSDYVAHGTSPSVSIAPLALTSDIVVAVKGDTAYEGDETVAVTLGTPTNATIASGKRSASSTITDNDRKPYVEVADATAVVEGDAGNTNKPMTFAVSLDKEATLPVSIPYTLGGTAGSGDFVGHGTNPSVKIASGDDSANIVVQIVGDDSDEPNETITVTLGAPTNATINPKAGAGSATGTITDNDDPALPVVSVGDATNVTEGDVASGPTLTFAVSMDNTSTQVVTVPYTLGGTAKSTEDYVAHSANPSISIAAGASTGDIEVDVVGDLVDEDNETVTVTLGTPTNAKLSTEEGEDTGSGTILDDDTDPTVTIANASAVTEGDPGGAAATLSFTVSLNAEGKQDVTVPYTIGGTAASGADYTAHPADSSITIDAGDTSGTIDVVVIADVIDENNETVTVTLGAPTNGKLPQAGSNATGTITDDDTDPTASVANASAVTEGDPGGIAETLSFTVSLDAEGKQDVIVPYTIGGTASSGVDFVAHGSNPSITIDAGDTSGTIDVVVIADVLDESNETVTITLGTPTNGKLPEGGSSASGTITDDDTIPIVSVANASAVTEGDPGGSAVTLSFTVSLNAEGKQIVTVPYTLTGTATSGVDYVAHATNPSITIAAGATSGSISVVVTSDLVDESNETVIVTLGAPTNGRLPQGGSSATGTITDDDTDPTASVANASAVPEGDPGGTAETLSFTVSLDAEGKQDVTVPYTIGGTASSGVDFVAHGSNPSITIDAGDTSGTIDVVVIADVLDESNETVTITLGTPTNGKLPEGGSSASGTITDDDTIPTVSVANASAVTEGDPGGSAVTLSFTVSLNAEGKQIVTVPYTLTGTATSGVDYVAHATNPSISIAAGATSVSISVVVTSDLVDESNETVIVTLGAPTNGRLPQGGSSATGTITDDDTDPTASVANASAVTEGDPGGTAETLSFTVSLDAEGKRDVTVPYTIGGTASSGVDFVAHGSNPSITIDAGDTSGTIDVVVIADVLDESDETVTITLGVPTNGKLPDGGSSASGTITDDDTIPTVSVANATAVTEGDPGDAATTLSFAVSLDEAGKQAVTVPYTLGGTASSGVDFVAHSANASITIAAGATSGSIDVVVVADVLDESNETVTVTLSAPTNAKLPSGGSSATGTITDDDTDPTVSVGNASAVTEGDPGDSASTLIFAVSLDVAGKQAVTVPYTLGGTAISGVDFVAHPSNASITIAAGATSGSIDVVVVADVLDESNETVTVTLSTPTNAELPPGGSSATGTITDDDTDPIVSVANASAVTEGDPGGSAETLSFTVSLDAEGKQDVTVPYTIGGTASSGVDFVAHPSNPSITIDAGDTSGTIDVAVIADVLDESNETVTITLGAPTNGTLPQGGSSATGTITDDDTDPTVSVANASAVTEGDPGDEAVSLLFTVSLDSEGKQDVSVPYTLGGSASSTVDFVAHAADASVTIEVGDTSATISVVVIGDLLDESDETVTVALGIPTNGKLSPNGSSASGTITDDDTDPVVSVANASDVTEGNLGEATSLSFEVSLDVAGKQDVTVSYTLSGSAISGEDYIAHGTSPSITIDAGESEGEIEVVVIGDEVDESNESVVVTLGTPTNGRLPVGGSSASGTIVDDDDSIIPIVSISDPPSILEGDEGALTEIAFPVQLSEEFQIDTAVSWVLSGTATLGEDFTIDESQRPLVIPAGNTSSQINLIVIGDALDEGDEEVLITIQDSSSNQFDTREGEANASFKLQNDDLPPMSVGPTVLTVTEGETASYSISLAHAPSERFEVFCDFGDAEDVQAHESISFSPNDWQEPKSFVISADSDDDAAEERITIRHPIQPEKFSSVLIDDVTVRVIDEDVDGLVLSTDMLYLDETDKGSYSIHLSAQPSGDVIIEPYSVPRNSLALTEVLTFTSENWSEPQTVDIQVVDNGLIINNRVKIEHAVFGSDYETLNQPATTVLITNITLPRVVLASTSLEINEGSSTDYGVFLATAPAGEITVTPRSSASDVIQVSGALTFDEQNWHVTQFATVSSIENDELEDQSVTIDHEISGDGIAITPQPLEVRIIDNDQPKIVVSERFMVLNEGRRASYQISLSAPPQNDVVVHIEGSDSEYLQQYTVSNELTFTPNNWNVPQSVVLIAHADNVAEGTQRDTLIHTVSPDEYPDAESKHLPISILDDDVRGIEFSPSELFVVEGGETEYNILLTSEPTHDVQITPRLSFESSTDDLLELPEPLTFTSLNWDRAQTVTVKGRPGTVSEMRAVTVSHELEGSGYDEILDAEIEVTYFDSDEFSVVVFPEDLMLKRGIPTSYQIALTAEPPDDVVIQIDTSTPEHVSVVDRVEINREDWQKPRTVELELSDVASFSDAVSTILTHRIDEGALGELAIPDVSVRFDLGEPELIASYRDIQLLEGETANVELTFAGPLLHSVTVEPEIARSDYIEFEPSSVTFDPDDWMSTKVIEVRSIDDDENGIVREEVTWKLFDSEGQLMAESLTSDITVFDNDSPSLVTSRSVIEIVEGSTQSYEIRLGSQPSGPVSIEPSLDYEGLILTPSVVEFASDDWMQYKSIRVEALEDGNDLDSRLTIVHEASGGGFDSASTADIQVDLIDNDTPSLAVPSRLVVHEGAQATYLISLESEPLSDVLVTAVPIDSSLLESSESVRFTPDDWDVPQQMTISSADDDESDSRETMIRHALWGSQYGDLRAPDVVVQILDNDESGIYVYPGRQTVEEGTSSSYSIVLQTEPTGNVEIAIESADPSSVSVDPQIEFTPANWNVQQEVRLESLANSTDVDTTVAISHEASGGGYDDIEIQDVVVLVEDVDPVIATPSSLSLQAGETGSYSLSLPSDPGQDLLVIANVSDPGSLAISPANLTIFASDWVQTFQFRVKVSGALEASQEDRIIEVVHTVASVADESDVIDSNAAKVQIVIEGSAQEPAVSASIALTTNHSAVVDVGLNEMPRSAVEVVLPTEHAFSSVSTGRLQFQAGNPGHSQSFTINMLDQSSTLDQATVRDIVRNIQVSSDDPRFDGSAVQITEFRDTRRGHHVAQSILQPINAEIARRNVDNVLDCIDAATKANDLTQARSDRQPSLDEFSGNLDSKTIGFVSDNLIDGEQSRMHRARSGSMDLGMEVSRRLMMCGGFSESNISSNQELSVQSRVNSHHIGGGLWLNPNFFAGVDFGFDRHQIDWNDELAEGTSDVRMRVVNPFLAHFDSTKQSRRWVMASIGEGSMQVVGALEEPANYRLQFEGGGGGGSWRVPSLPALELYGEGWFARTKALSSVSHLADVTVSNHVFRLGGESTWKYLISTDFEISASLAGGLLHDSSFGSTGYENLIGLGFEHRGTGLRTDIQLRTIATSDQQFSSQAWSGNIEYRADKCCSAKGPWFSMTLGESGRSGLQTLASNVNNSMHRQFDASRGNDSWGLETGWHADWRMGSWSFVPAMTFDKLRDRRGYELGFRTTADQSENWKLSSQIMSRVHKNQLVDRGFRVALDIKW